MWKLAHILRVFESSDFFFDNGHERLLFPFSVSCYQIRGMYNGKNFEKPRIEAELAIKNPVGNSHK